MKKQEMVELVQQHHPHMNETQIIKLLDRAKNDFCAKTEIVKEAAKVDLVSGQRYYPITGLATFLSEGIELIKISEVWIDRVKAPRLIHPPTIEDNNEPFT